MPLYGYIIIYLNSIPVSRGGFGVFNPLRTWGFRKENRKRHGQSIYTISPTGFKIPTGPLSRD